jgi:hypothetical protein
MTTSPLLALHALGQSVGQDHIRRDLLAPTGELEHQAEAGFDLVAAHGPLEEEGEGARGLGQPPDELRSRPEERRRAVGTSA